MSAPSPAVIHWGRERARTAPWRGDGRIAHLVPMPDEPPLSEAFVRQALAVLGGQGYRRVVTSALTDIECASFLALGFEVVEGLHLLVHDLFDLPRFGEVAGRLRRAWAFDRAAVIDLDNRAFPAFWQLDFRGLDDAIAATPRARFRVAVPAAGAAPCGYAVCGIAGRRGFVQRLAVHPDLQGKGYGRALLIDGLHWMSERSVTAAVVNTQLGNTAALTLYERTGFRRQEHGLAVLSIGLPPVDSLR